MLSGTEEGNKYKLKEETEKFQIKISYWIQLNKTAG